MQDSVITTTYAWFLLLPRRACLSELPGSLCAPFGTDNSGMVVYRSFNGHRWLRRNRHGKDFGHGEAS